jgi:hypothetical protein
MLVFLEQEGKTELARRLLLLGSGYLDRSLGHSISCTAFILLEMIARRDQDPWPAIGTLAEYFCRGHFHSMPAIPATADIHRQAELDGHLLRATSGYGIVNLHYTITRYAIERVRHLLSETEYAHLITSWINYLGTKSVEASPVYDANAKAATDYASFQQCFVKRDEQPVLSALAGLVSSQDGRLTLGRYLVKGVCDQYQGNYDPHFLTGLGAALWVVDRYWDNPALAMNALSQCLNHFFTRMG